MLRLLPMHRASSNVDEPSPPTLSVMVTTPSFQEIYQHYFEFVWGCSRRLGVSDLELDDIVQEVFIVIHRRLDTVEHLESLRSWIYGIVRRTVSTYRRAKRAKLAATSAFLAEPDLQYPVRPSPQELAEQSDQARLLWLLLDQLEQTKREVFVLAELDELTVPEIASILNVPLNTVYSRLRAARQELEAALIRFNARTQHREHSCLT